MVCTVTEK
uniref:Uncharacterized protein n=1 Tax=Anguilla anguilla TaxID=7936 RepID=A0A0E9VM78_ANGAN